MWRFLSTMVLLAILLPACERAQDSGQYKEQDKQAETAVRPADETPPDPEVDKPDSSQTAKSSAPEPQALLAELDAAVSAETPPAENVEVSYVVKGGQRASGNPILKAIVGQKIVITIESDQDDELHMHGYDIHGHIHAGKPETIEFVADRAGRFDFELHDSHLDLGVLEVYPE